jgi:hypothetical protein
MKKIMSLMLGMSLVLGAATLAFASPDDKGSADTKKTGMGKKGSKKGSKTDKKTS